MHRERVMFNNWYFKYYIFLRIKVVQYLQVDC